MSEITTKKAQTFWQAYTERDFVELKRQGNGNYEGVLLDFGDDEDAMFGEESPFSITRQELVGYDYSTDKRFAPCVFKTLESALSVVLKDRELMEPTDENRRRLQLIIQFIRDRSLSEPSFSVIVRTRKLVEQYADGKLGEDAVSQRLRNLRKGRDKNFEVLCQTVLEYLEMDVLSTDLVVSLLSSNTPLPEKKHPFVLRAVLQTVPDCELSIDKACQFLQVLLPTKADYEELTATGRVSSVKTERDILLKALSMCPTDRRIASQFLRILHNHANEDMFVVFETISALGFHNDKSCIAPLVECLAQDDMVRYRDTIEEALQMLCSGSTLIPKAIFGMDLSRYTDEELEESDQNEDQEPKIEHEYWCEKEKTLPATPIEWQREDAESVFWQKRLRCALADRDSKLPPNLLNALQNDEVATVRNSSGGSESTGDRI